MVSEYGFKKIVIQKENNQINIYGTNEDASMARKNGEYAIGPIEIEALSNIVNIFPDSKFIKMEKSNGQEDGIDTKIESKVGTEAVVVKKSRKGKSSKVESLLLPGMRNKTEQGEGEGS